MGITGAPFSIKVVYFFNGFVSIFLFSYIFIWLGFPLFSDLTATLGHFPFFTLLPYSVSLCRPFLYLILKHSQEIQQPGTSLSHLFILPETQGSFLGGG